MTSSIAILSGGMDSTAAMCCALAQVDDELKAVSFDYGQRHRKELIAAKDICDGLGVEHHIINVSDINRLLHGSALTSNVDVPEGHYESENMRATVVANRNMIFASIALGYAVAEKASTITLGVHAGDHAVYPDCRPEFVDQLERMAHIANEGFIDPEFFVFAPWVHVSKADIIRLSEYNGYDVPWEKTWTCYNGGEIHCGRCATCVERLEAFHIAGVYDPAEYADREYWAEVCNIEV